MELGKIPEIVLLHSPMLTDKDNLIALTQLQIKFPESIIGVSNFDIPRLNYLIMNNVKPGIISLEYSPYYQPRALIKFCKDHNIFITGYRCLAKGQVLKDPIIIKLAQKYNTTASSILLSWARLNEVIPIFSTNNPQHIEVKLSVLTQEDMDLIDSLNKGSTGATCMLRYCNHDKF